MHASSPELDGHELPPHVEESVRSIIEFQAQHARSATAAERFAANLIATLGRPVVAVGVLVFVASWAALNLGATLVHAQPFDPPPFFWLQGLVSLTALCMTILVLSTQRRLDRVAEERAQLTLQVAIVGDQKIAKVIALLEELRSDHPQIADRHDPLAAAMAEPTDPQTVLDALRETGTEILGPSP